MPPLMSALITLCGALTLATGCGSTGPGDPQASVSLGTRHGHAMAWDEARHQLLLFGGSGPEGGSGASLPRNSLWRWNGTAWTRLDSTGPSPRVLASMVYDAGRGKVVLYGGQTGDFPNVTLFDDTWEWDGARWTRVATTGPGGRFHQSMAYDRVRGRVVLYGGFTLAGGGTELRDIWEWNGSAWTQAAASGPAGLSARGAAFDEGAGVLYLFSAGSDGVLVADRWNGIALERAAGAAPPCLSEGRQLTGLGPAGGLLFIIDRCDPNTATAETWRLGAGAWARVPGTQPPLRTNAALAWDRDRNRVVLFGGEVAQGVPDLGDTWQWNGTQWTRISPP